jgi:hypothetical protein
MDLREIRWDGVDWIDMAQDRDLSFRRADCDIDYHLVVAKFRERLTVSKQALHRFHMERFNLKKLKKVEDKEQYRLEI